MNRTLGSYHEVYNDYARNLIRMKARHLARRADFSRSDEEDIAQDLTVHLLSQAAHFDPDRGRVTTFVSMVIESGIAMLLRKRGRQRCKPGNVEIQSLDTMVDVPDEPPAALWSLISVADLDRRTGSRTQAESVALEEREAFDHTLNSLPLNLQQVCLLLMSVSPTVAARQLRISRYRLGKSMVAIRKHFTKAGLGRE